MVNRLNIYDPVRIQLLDDVAHKLMDKDELSDELRIEAMVCISQMRSLVRRLAPPRSQNQAVVQQHLTTHPEWFNMIYWDEYAEAEYKKISELKKAEEGAIAWIGA